MHWERSGSAGWPGGLLPIFGPLSRQRKLCHHRVYSRPVSPHGFLCRDRVSRAGHGYNALARTTLLGRTQHNWKAPCRYRNTSVTTELGHGMRFPCRDLVLRSGVTWFPGFLGGLGRDIGFLYWDRDFSPLCRDRTLVLRQGLGWD